MTDDTREATGGPADRTGPFARIGAELDHLLRAAAPSGQACEHFTSARIEMLKGIRAVIDARIERLSKEPKKGVTIKID